MNIEIQTAGEAELPEIAALAAEIWRAHYPGIISTEQIEYMLDWMFDPVEMRRQLAAGTVYKTMTGDGVLAGFASYAPTPTPREFKLDKLYVHERFRGRGLGRRLLDHVIERVRATGAASLVLAVNKRNHGAVRMYQRSGFRIRESVVNDIGRGFVMDDYVMALAF